METEAEESSNLENIESAAALKYRVGCEEHRRLLDEYGAAVQELLMLHDVQFIAVVEDDHSSRFDLLIEMANNKKQQAKYAYLRHLESHGCADFDGINDLIAK
jgi:hypothetical protein